MGITAKQFLYTVDDEGLDYTLVHYYGLEALASIEDEELRELALAALSAVERLEDWVNDNNYLLEEEEEEEESE